MEQGELSVCQHLGTFSTKDSQVAGDRPLGPQVGVEPRPSNGSRVEGLDHPRVVLGWWRATPVWPGLSEPERLSHRQTARKWKEGG